MLSYFDRAHDRLGSHVVHLSQMSIFVVPVNISLNVNIQAPVDRRGTCTAFGA
jgi:hypothetical protein